MHDDLAELAGQLARLGKGEPKQATLRRSISTAYYALFHALCHTCVTALIGWNKPWSVTTPLYRMLDHGTAKRVFSQIRSRKDADGALRTIAETFLVLQDARLEADYDPGARFTRDEVLKHVAQAVDTITILRTLPPDARLDLAVQLVTKQR